MKTNAAPAKKMPVRMCVGCREHKPKKELIRVCALTGGRDQPRLYRQKIGTGRLPVREQPVPCPGAQIQTVGADAGHHHPRRGYTSWNRSWPHGKNSSNNNLPSPKRGRADAKAGTFHPVACQKGRQTGFSALTRLWREMRAGKVKGVFCSADLSEKSRKELLLRHKNFACSPLLWMYRWRRSSRPAANARAL